MKIVANFLDKARELFYTEQLWPNCQLHDRDLLDRNLGQQKLWSWIYPVKPPSW